MKVSKELFDAIFAGGPSRISMLKLGTHKSRNDRGHSREYKGKLRGQLSPIFQNLTGKSIDDTWYDLKSRYQATAIEPLGYESGRRRNIWFDVGMTKRGTHMTY